MADLRTDGRTEPRPSLRQGVLVLLVLALVQFTSIVDFMVVMPLGPQMIRKLGLTTRQFSLIVASYSISAGLAGLLASSIMDRFGRKSAYQGLFAGFLLGTLACCLTREYNTLLAAGAACRRLGGLLGGLGLTIVADVFPEEQRGRATGVLMSAFALASVFGVPVGLQVGTVYGWHVPFLILAAVGTIVFLAGVLVMPALREHLHQGAQVHPVTQAIETFRQPGNLVAFALTGAVMFGAFAVIPYISLSLVANVGVPEEKLWLVFLTGGILTLIGAPLIGGLADRFGKVLVFRIVAVIAACLILVVTNLPVVPLAAAVGVVGLLMVSNAGRMTASMSMITTSRCESRFRGGLMSANSAVQHVSAGLAAYVGGRILARSEDGFLHNFSKVGLISVVATLISLWLAGRVKQPAGKVTSADNSESAEVTAGLLE